MPDPTFKAEVGAMAQAARTPSLEVAMSANLEALPDTDPLKAERLKRLRLAQTIGADVNVERLNALPPLETLDNRIVDNTIVDGLKNRIQVNLYEGDPTASGTAANEATARQAGLQQRLEIYKKFDADGYSRLSDGTGGTVNERQLFEQSMMPFIQRDPILNQWYQTIENNNALKTEFFNNMFDTEFKEKFRQELFTVVDAPDTFHAKQTELETAKAARDEKRQELTTQNVAPEIARLTGEIQNFEPDLASGLATTGSKLERLQNNRAIANAPDAQTKIHATDSAKAIYDKAKIDKDKWLADPLNAATIAAAAANNPPTEPYPDESILKNSENDYTSKKAASDVIVKAKEEIAALQTEEKTLRERKSELGGKQADMKQAEATVVRLEGDLANLEKSWIDQIQKIPTEASRAWFIAEDKRINDLIDSKTAEALTAGKTDAEIALRQNMNTRYLQKVRGPMGLLRRLLGAEATKPNRENLNDDITEVMAKGPDKLIKTFLTAQINPETGVPYTKPEVTTLLENIPVRDGLRTQMMDSLFARKMNKDTGGGVSRELWFEICDNKQTAQYGAHALEEIKTFQKGLADLTEQNALNRQFVWNLAKRTLSIGGLIALIAGSIAATPII